jgi:hypothetical protein
MFLNREATRVSASQTAREITSGTSAINSAMKTRYWRRVPLGRCLPRPKWFHVGLGQTHVVPSLLRKKLNKLVLIGVASSSGYTGKTFPKTGKFFPKRTNSESKQKDRPKAVSVFTIGF